MYVLEHSIGDLAIHFVTWILGGRNLLIHYTPKHFAWPLKISKTKKIRDPKGAVTEDRCAMPLETGVMDVIAKAPRPGLA